MTFITHTMILLVFMHTMMMLVFLQTFLFKMFSFSLWEWNSVCVWQSYFFKKMLLFSLSGLFLYCPAYQKTWWHWILEYFFVGFHTGMSQYAWCAEFWFSWLILPLLLYLLCIGDGVWFEMELLHKSQPWFKTELFKKPYS